MIAIIDYKAGNLTSVKLAFDSIGIPAQITRDPQEIFQAKRIVFPGDGAAESAMDHLKKLNLIDVVPSVVERGIPFLGICLGTQIILDYSEENGGTTCLGVIPGEIRRFAPSNPMDKIPQMGWNTVAIKTPHPLLNGIEDNSEFYFIHSYYPTPSKPQNIIGETDYADSRFASMIGEGNLFATQFHPERSGRIGLKLLENFSKWDGKC